MNIANRLAHVTLIAATVCAAFMLQNANAAPAVAHEVCIVELPRVIVVGKREPVRAVQVRVVELPRVVITAKRMVPNDTVFAQRAARSARV